MNADWPQPPTPDCQACYYYSGRRDPDYCDYLYHGICHIGGRPCPVVVRDGPTLIQLINDIIISLAGPLVAAWAKKLNEGKRR
jgi:hypothetical protein